MCVAARLAEAGAEVTLLEQAEPGQAATRSSFAWLNSNDKTPRAYHDLNHAGMRAWAELSRSAGAPSAGGTSSAGGPQAANASPSADGAGQPAWYRPSGNLEWAGSAGEHRQLAARVRRPHRMGIPGRPDRRGRGRRAGTGPPAALAGDRGRLVPRRGLPAHRAHGRARDRAGRRARGHGADRRGRPRGRHRRRRRRGAGGADGGRRGHTGRRGRVLRGTLGAPAGRAGRIGLPGAAGPVVVAGRGSPRARRPGRPGARR